MHDQVTCNGCGQTTARTAQKGITLQPSPDFICTNCQSGHDNKSGAVAAERARVEAELKAAHNPQLEAVLPE